MRRGERRRPMCDSRGPRGSICLQGSRAGGYNGDMPAPIPRSVLLAAALLMFPLPTAALEALEKDGHWAHSVNDAVGAPVVINGKAAGSGSRLANVEAGLPCTQHVLLRHLNSGNLFAGPGADKPVESHPTAVSSVLVGRAPDGDARFSGLAPGADFRAGTFAVKGDATANPFTMRSLLGAFEQAFTWADVVNTSWGSVTPPGTYEFYSDLLDALCAEHPTCLFVVAAGNTQAERWGASRGKVSQIASGFNNLSVGALGNAPAFDRLTANSARLPLQVILPDGRAAGTRSGIDICAPGEYLRCAICPPGPHDQHDRFLRATGTSVAAPVVAGAAALLHGRARDLGLPAEIHDARVMKALLLAGARSVPSSTSSVGADRPSNGARSERGRQGLDAAVGAGMLDAAASLQAMEAGHWRALRLASGARESGSQRTELGDLPQGAELTAALCCFVPTRMVLQDGVRSADELPEDAGTKPELICGPIPGLSLELLCEGRVVARCAEALSPTQFLRVRLPESGHYELRITRGPGFERAKGVTAQQAGEPPLLPCGLAWHLRTAD